MNHSRTFAFTLALMLVTACDDNAPPPDEAADAKAERQAEDDKKAADARAAADAQKKVADDAFADVRTGLQTRFAAWNAALAADDVPNCAKVDAAGVGAAGKAYTLDRALLQRAAEGMAVPAMVTGEVGSPSFGYTSGALWAVLEGPVSDETIDKVHSSQRRKLREDKDEAMKAAPALDGMVHGIVLDPKEFVAPQFLGEQQFKAGHLVADAYLFREDTLVCRMRVDTEGETSVKTLTIDGEVGTFVDGRLANDLERSGRTQAGATLSKQGLITGIDDALWPPQG
jgi:hypothetical protein